MKRVVGGSALPGDWELSAKGSGGEISGAGSVSGVLVPGLYTLAESGGPDGYVSEGWVCDGELLPDDQLTITAADADAGVDCSITNTNFEVDPDVVCRDNTRPMISYRVTGLDTGAEDTVDVTLFDLDNRPVGRLAGRKLNDMVAHPGGARGASDLLRGGGFLVAEVRGIASLPAIYGQVPSNCGTPPLVKVWLDCGPVPHVMYKVLEPARGPVTITLPSLSGLETFAGQPLEGRRLYPGASENPNDWPGRLRGPDGAWVVDPSDIQLAEGGVLTASGDGFTTKTTYPALYPPCPPTNSPELTLVKPPEFDLIAVGFDRDNRTPGTYTLEPSGPDGYELPVRCDNADGEVTTVTLRAGDDVTCTLEPKELPPSLTIEKQVVNDDGGTAGPDDFVVAAVGYDSTSPQPGDYPLQHVSGPPDYDLTITCDNAVGEVTFVTLNPGDDVTCVFAYRAKAPPPTTTTTTTTTIRPVDTPVPTTAEPTNARCTGVVAEGDFCVVLDDLADDGDCAESHTYSVYLVNRTDREQDVDVFLIADFVPRSPSFESLVVPLTVPKFSSSADVRPHPISVPIPAGAHRVNARVRVVPEGSGVALEGFETTLRRCDA